MILKNKADGLEVSRTPKGLPEQLAIVLTYQCKLVLILYQIRTDNSDAKDRNITIILREQTAPS